MIDPERLAFDKEVLETLNVKIREEDLREIYKMLYESFSEWFNFGQNQIEKGKDTLLIE